MKRSDWLDHLIFRNRTLFLGLFLLPVVVFMASDDMYIMSIVESVAVYFVISTWDFLDSVKKEYRYDSLRDVFVVLFISPVVEKALQYHVNKSGVA